MSLQNLFTFVLSVTVMSCAACSSSSSSSSPLFEATTAGDFSRVKRLVSQGADIDIVHTHTPLQEAVIKGHTTLVAYFLKKGADPNGKKTNQTPLHSAARYDRLDEARLLIAHGANIKIFNNDGQMPMHRAAGFGSVQVLDYFLNVLKISPDIRALDGRTALHYAAGFGHRACVQLLLKNKATVDAQERFGWLVDVYVLRKKNECTLGTIGWGRTPFHLACENGHLGVVKLLIESGASIHKPAHTELTALDLACSYNRLPIIELLLSLGVDPNKESAAKESPLFIASEQGFTQAVRLLLKAGARANTQPEHNRAPLQIACKNEHLEIIELLLAHGADVVKSGAFLSACVSGNAKVVELLLNHGADPNSLLGYPEQRTPSTIACAQGNISLMQVLLNHGADIRIPGPLHAACSYGHLETVQFLVAQGADIHAENRSGRSPLELACNPLRWKEEEGYPRIVEYLLSLSAKERAYTNWNLIERNGNTETAALLLAYGQTKDADHYLSGMCKRGHLSIVQLFVKRGFIPKGFEIKDTFPVPIKEYLAEALHPRPIEPDDYRYQLCKPKPTIGSSLVAACSNMASSKPVQKKYKID